MLADYLASVVMLIKIVSTALAVWCFWMSACPWDIKGVNKRTQRIIGCIALAITVFTPTSNWITTYLGN